jgi:hypothetical protein
MEPAAATPASIYNVVQLGALGGTGGEASDIEGGRIVGGCHPERSEGDHARYGPFASLRVTITVRAVA